MLEKTKGLSHETFKLIAESLENNASDLTSLKNTLAQLHLKLGYSYFQGNFAERGRYAKLIDLWTPFIMKIIAQLK
jgi:hypothetical protein